MLTVRHILTTTTNADEIVPDLDAHGREIELWSVDVPANIEAEGGAAIDAYVAAQRAKATAPAAPATQPEDVTHG